MPTLFLHLPCYIGETALSFGTRLAAFHLGQTLVPFLHDIGVRPDALVRGEADAFDRMADAAGVDAGILHRNSARSVAKSDYILRGHELSGEVFSRPDTAFCPECLLEDDAYGAKDVAAFRRQRMAWTLRSVRTCTRHGLSLIHRRVGGYDRKFHGLARQVPERGDELRRLIDDCEQGTPSPLQAYVLARLEGVSGPEWLDSEKLEQAVRTSEYVGVLVEFGPSTKPSDLTHDQRDQADRVGFAVIAEGEAEIRRALADAQAAFADTGATPGRRKIFGGLYEWVSSTKLHKEPGDIRRIMREHIFDTMEIAAGEIILGGSLTERRLHSVQSLAIKSGLNPKTLRNVLAASELIPADAKVIANHVFDAEAGRKVAAPVPQAVSVSKLGNVLGCTRPQADQFLDERLLLPLAEGSKESAGRVWKSVGKDEVDQFVADLHASVRSGRASWHGFDLESGREVEGAECRDCPSHSRRLPRERRTESRRPRSRGIARRFGRGPDRAGRSCAGKLCDGSVRQTAYSEIRRLASRSSGNRTAPSRNGRRRQERTASVL